MPWFKTDDKLHDHRKTRRALRSHTQKRRDTAAMGLWIVAGTWSADNLTDGFIPADELDRWDDHGADLAYRLVEAGFWEPAVHDDEPGFRFVNWAERQPTKEEVEARRAVRAEAGRKGGLSSGRTRRGEAKPKQVASRLLEPPTRPDPSPSAAAAADAPRGGSGSRTPAPVPGDVQVLMSKLRSHTVLAGLSDDVVPERLARISELIAAHGDQKLVDYALRTCRTPPPVYVSAFIDTWEAIGAPRAVAPAEPRCTTCNRTKTDCDRANQTAHADTRHPFQEAS